MGIQEEGFLMGTEFRSAQVSTPTVIALLNTNNY